MKTFSTRRAQFAPSPLQQDPPSGQHGQKEQPPSYGFDFADHPLQTVQPMSAIGRAVAPESIAVNTFNRTGLPDTLKTGIEQLSGYSLDAVQVQYNSDKPAQLQALAYAQGTEIHIGPGQERHLPHEAWHVVQQAQGRVEPTTTWNGQRINDHPGLEAEADRMGKLAVETVSRQGAAALKQGQTSRTLQTIQRVSVEENPINWNDVKEVKSLKLGKVLLLTGSDGKKLVLKVETAPFQALQAAQTLLTDIVRVSTPKIRELGYAEQMQLSEFLKVNNSSAHKMFFEELATEIQGGAGRGKYIYAMEFMEGKDFEDVPAGNDGWRSVITSLKDPELQQQLGAMHAVDLFVGNKDRGLINLGNWKIGADGNIIAFDSADANSYANRFLTQAPSTKEEKEQMNIDFQETLNKLHTEAEMQREAAYQFETLLPSSLNKAGEAGLTDEIKAAVQLRLAPYTSFIKGMKMAANALVTKLSMNAYADQPWGNELTKRAAILSSSKKDLRTTYN